MRRPGYLSSEEREGAAVPQRTWQARMTAHPEAGRTDHPAPVPVPDPDTSRGSSAAGPALRPPAGRRGQPGDRGEPARPGSGSAAPPRLTARGAGLAMFSVFFPGTLTAGWLHLAVLTGLSFLVGCILAGLFTKRADLLVVVTMPPMVFLVAVICVKALTATGSALISTAEGCLLTLSAAAPWLFGGMAVIIVIALFRGLPHTIGEIRAGLRGRLDSGDRRKPGDPRDVFYRP